MARPKQATRQKNTQKAADAAKKAAAKLKRPKIGADPEMDMEEEVEFDPPENGCTTVYWSGNSNLSVDADLKDSVESAMRKLAELHGHKIAEGKDALRYELLGKERYYPTFNDVVNMWYDEGDVNGWEALNITVHFKTMPMTASEAKESEFRGVLAGSHVGHRSTCDRGDVVEEQVWFEPGDNGCYCGLTRKGSDGPLTVRAELDDPVDHVMRRLAQIYGFSIAMGADALQSEALAEEATLRDVLESEGSGVTKEGKVCRLTIAVTRA